MADTAVGTETGAEQEPMGTMSQADADNAFELDLAHAGLLDSPLEFGDTDSGEQEPIGTAAVPATPGASPEAKAGETPPATPKADATIADPKAAAKAAAKAAPSAQAPDASNANASEKEPTGEELAAKAVPFAFTSDGQTTTVDMIREIPGMGLVIEQPGVDRFRNMMQTADKALKDNVKLRDMERQYTQLGGTEKYRELQSQSAALDAMGTELLKIVADPQKLISLASDPRERELLLRELQWLGNTKAQEAAQTFGAAREQADAAGTQQAQDTRAFNIAIDSMAKALPMLTPEDVQAIRVQFSQPGMRSALYRQTTAADAKYGLPPGKRVIDIPLMHPYAQRLAEVRIAQKTEADARAKAEAENKQRTSTAAPVAARRPAAAPKQPTGRRGGAANTKDPSWSEIKNAWLSGRHAIAADTD